MCVDYLLKSRIRGCFRIANFRDVPHHRGSLRVSGNTRVHRVRARPIEEQRISLRGHDGSGRHNC